MTHAHRRSFRPRPRAAALALALLLNAATAGAASAPDPAAPHTDITWGQIAARVSCMLSSWLDMGLRGVNLGVGKCALYLPIQGSEG